MISAAGAPPCWASGSQGPRVIGAATNRSSRTSKSAVVDMAGDGTRLATLGRMDQELRTQRDEATFTVKAGLAEMLKGGVIMDVVTPEQAKIAEDAGAAAVMALERVPADIRRDGGVARMSDPEMIRGIQEAVTIPVMAKARIGHFAEAQVLEALEVDYIDESEVLTPADEANHIDKWAFKIPFVCGATNLGEALRRIGEGAAMIRSKGEAGTGDIVEAVRHLRKIRAEIRRLATLDDGRAGHRGQGAAVTARARAPGRRATARLPVVLFCAGGIATPADASLVMQLGAEGVFVGSGIFKSEDPERRARAIVEATTHFQDPARVAAACTGLGQAMHSLETRKLEAEQLLATRLVPPRSGEPCRDPRPSGGLRGPRQGSALAGRHTARGAGARRPRGLGRPHPAGGESTVMTLGIEREGLAQPLRDLVAAGTPVLGTCAGMIMLDRAHLGVLDILAARNAFGRQLHSFEADLEIEGVAGEPVHAVFIRAPWVAQRGPDIQVLADVDGHPVAIRQGNVIALSFHPELTGERRLHELLLSLVGAGGDQRREADRARSL